MFWLYILSKRWKPCFCFGSCKLMKWDFCPLINIPVPRISIFVIDTIYNGNRTLYRTIQGDQASNLKSSSCDMKLLAWGTPLSSMTITCSQLCNIFPTDTINRIMLTSLSPDPKLNFSETTFVQNTPHNVYILVSSNPLYLITPISSRDDIFLRHGFRLTPNAEI